MLIVATFTPQVAFTFTPKQLAGMDRRFCSPDALPHEPQFLLQDLAALLDAHLTLSHAERLWMARPEGQPAQELLTEQQWSTCLCLGPDVHDLNWSAFQQVRAWRQGAAYLFHGLLVRSYNLRSEFDRIELEYLLTVPPPSGTVIRAHRLSSGGHLQMWRLAIP